METLIEATNLETFRKHDQERTYHGQSHDPGDTLLPQVDMERSRTEDISQAPHLSQSIGLEATTRRQLESTDDELSRHTAVGEALCPSPQMAPASTPRFDLCSEARPNADYFAQVTIEGQSTTSNLENVRFSLLSLKGITITVD
jgi:hypothetical protein